MPPLGFLMLHQNGLQQEDETFRLLVSMYWVSENLILTHLGLNSVAMATLLLRSVSCSFSENYKKSSISTSYHPLIHRIISNLDLTPKIKPLYQS